MDSHSTPTKPIRGGESTCEDDRAGNQDKGRLDQPVPNQHRVVHVDLQTLQPTRGSRSQPRRRSRLSPAQPCDSKTKRWVPNGRFEVIDRTDLHAVILRWRNAGLLVDCILKHKDEAHKQSMHVFAISLMS